MAVAELARQLEPGPVDRPHAALALDRLDEHRAGLGADRRRERLEVVAGTWEKPAGTGSNGSRLAADQPAASVASVRPWNEPSRHTMACFAGRRAPARAGGRA